MLVSLWYIVWVIQYFFYVYIKERFQSLLLISNLVSFIIWYHFFIRLVAFITYCPTCLVTKLLRETPTSGIYMIYTIKLW